ncbi:MAG TPA: M23 family metallopeptidase [Anaerolineaceae bacterium]|nr:M23 family metallopeptidase [Anaerolineaceae bacterium]HQP62033.1 M23 family metallopeptidase [Anaerolineaceae bacterium]
MKPRFNPLFLIPVLLAVAAGVAVYVMVFERGAGSARSARVWEWLKNPQAHPDWAVQAGERCGDAPFQMPTSGLIGFLWDDSFRPGHRHSGLDIFGGSQAGITPVHAAYDGYLTRLADWKSTVIIRIPSDPLQPGRQIWTYYTHMASPAGESFVDAAFPPGISEVFVPAGTLLGYQGNYSGTPGNPTGVHLHFSIVLDDGNGSFRNELEIANTLDPSPYLGIALNARQNPADLPVCP